MALTALVCGCGASLPPKATASGKKVTKTATDADVEAIRDLLDRLTSAINTNNSQHSAAVFTEQGTLLPHGEHTVVGAANIRAWFESQFAHSTYRDTAMAIDEVEAGGNWAFARGPYHQLVTPRNGGAPVPSKASICLLSNATRMATGK